MLIIYIWLFVLSVGLIFLFLTVRDLLKVVSNIQNSIKILQNNHMILNRKIIPNLEKINKN